MFKICLSPPTSLHYNLQKETTFYNSGAVQDSCFPEHKIHLYLFHSDLQVAKDSNSGKHQLVTQCILMHQAKAMKNNGYRIPEHDSISVLKPLLLKRA